MPAFKAIDVFDGSRALLNDQENATFTNTIQQPYLKMAYEWVRQQCEEYNIPITNKTSLPITVNAGITDIGGPTGPPLPIDLIDIFECWEIPAGTNDDYMLMRRMQFLPKTAVQTAYLEVYEWSDQFLHFIGATGAVQVKIDYIADDLGAIIDGNSQIRVTNAINLLKFKTAAFTAMFAGENPDRALALNSLAEDALGTFLNIPIKAQQNIRTRRRPFMSAYKLRGGTYGR